ncbi:ATP-binding protein [Paraburkholderia nodosa]|uniref:ATP-binding protein n=1 Tax=Paraburkholderia nodosa TaxID=392320 RepID=UPI0004B67F85|nr:ATP-binding protein [Paraburkholderia nodosa]
MMRLFHCEFQGLAGFSELDLDNLKDLTIFVGPNGAGKSTILRVLRLAFEILNRKTLCDIPPSHRAWDRFEVATLRFRSGVISLPPKFAEYLGVSDEIVVDIVCNESQFIIQRICCGDNEMQFAQPQITKTKISEHIKGIENLEEQKIELAKRRHTQQAQQAPQTPQQIQQLNTQIAAAEENLRQQNAQLGVLRSVPVQLGSGETLILERDEVDSLLESLEFPQVQFVDTQLLHEEAIPKLITELLREKKGRKAQSQQFAETMNRLSHLLQSDVDVSEEEGHADMHINGVPYARASSGTQITLSFFGLTRLGEPGCIVLWDEPENGLHPTRRARLLNLMFADGRQFVLATHAAEFAPVFSENGKVFRCDARYDEQSTEVSLTVEHVADRRDAFLALEALGVHPARTLFTANVVIWVEGPTELLFYRHWLNPRMRAQGFIEGFHYTFMQYGGALISYLSIADDAQLESTFDLLSMCRHPVIIVDSDLKEDPNGRPPSDFLKKGAARLLSEVNKLNQERPGAAMFDWTEGREVENYLPESAIWHAISSLWKGYQDYSEKLQSVPLIIGQYESYEESLTKHFCDLHVTDASENNESDRRAKGRSIWGAGNKVEMMQKALTAPNLVEATLNWKCANRLAKMEAFISNVCAK